MASHQNAQDSGNRLRLIAAASVVALAVVLSLAAVTADQRDGGPHGQAGHSASHQGSQGGQGGRHSGAADGD
jgi:Spy/CpxP family protein refolding chaperone